MKSVLKEGGEAPFLDALVSGSTAGTIEAQEARGQRSFVTSDTLPADMNAETRAALVSAGVVFGEICPNDPIFQFVTLPEGWARKPTDHSMWSLLVDAEGKTRAEIFYKAAFYDRHAELYLAKAEPETEES